MKYESTPNKLIRILGEDSPLWKRIVAYATAPGMFDQFSHSGLRKRKIAEIIAKYYNLREWDFWLKNIHCVVHDYPLSSFADPEWVKSFIKGWIEARDKVDALLEAETGHGTNCDKKTEECWYND